MLKSQVEATLDLERSSEPMATAWINVQQRINDRAGSRGEDRRADGWLPVPTSKWTSHSFIDRLLELRLCLVERPVEPIDWLAIGSIGSIGLLEASHLHYCRRIFPKDHLTRLLRAAPVALALLRGIDLSAAAAAAAASPFHYVKKGLRIHLVPVLCHYTSRTDASNHPCRRVSKPVSAHTTRFPMLSRGKQALSPQTPLHHDPTDHGALALQASTGAWGHPGRHQRLRTPRLQPPRRRCPLQQRRRPCRNTGPGLHHPCLPAPGPLRSAPPAQHAPASRAVALRLLQAAGANGAGVEGPREQEDRGADRYLLGPRARDAQGNCGSGCCALDEGGHRATVQIDLFAHCIACQGPKAHLHTPQLHRRWRRGETIT